MSCQIKFFLFLLSVIEIGGLIIYIFQLTKTSLSEEINTGFLKELKINLYNTYGNNTNQYYYYLEEFRRILPHKDENGKSIGRSNLSNIVNYYYIPTFILITIGGISCLTDNYIVILYMFYICGILTFCAFIDSLFYPYKVDIPKKEIYIFKNEFNDKIKEKLADKLDTKIYLIGSTIAIIVSLIIHIIISHLLLKNEKNEDNNHNIIHSSLIKKKKVKEKDDSIGPILD